MDPVAIRILCLEDSPADAALIRRQLEKSAIACAITAVDGREPFLAAVTARDGWDAILSDWRIPGYNGMQAFNDARRLGCEAPFLVVSGTIGAEDAVEALKAGVADYLLKDRLERLPMALQRSLDDVRVRNERLADQRRLADSELRFRLLSESTPDLIILCDDADRILYLNAAVPRILACPPDHLVGHAIDDLLPPDSAAWFRRHLGQVHTSGGPRTGEMPALLADQPYWFDVRSVPFRIGDGDRTGVLTVARDITDRKRMEDDLRGASAAAQAANVAKSQFLAVMSHELRTPLNGLLGMTSLLTAADLPPDLHEMAELIQQSGQNLLQIISGILDFSNLETGRVTVERKVFNLPHMVNGVADHFRPLADRKHVELKVEVDTAVPVLAEGDHLHLCQVLTSLVGNAVKFTECGHVLIRVAPGADLGDAQRIRLSVADTGIGIADEDQRRLFQPFTPVDSSLTRRHGGCGIGLVVARRLVELMGGTLEVESAAGMGTCFTILVPLTRVMRTDDTPGTTREPRQQPPRILVVDDDAVNRLVIERMLLAGGCQVSLAEDGREAVLACRGSAPDLVLMDIQMPHMDGWEATLAIRAEERGQRRMPIIAVTAYVSDEARQRCRAAGMDDFLPKPINLKTLWEVVTAHTGWHLKRP